jgi:peptidyl-prolyl cis-trans isomerase B (cyclophilin B)
VEHQQSMKQNRRHLAIASSLGVLGVAFLAGCQTTAPGDASAAGATTPTVTSAVIELENGGQITIQLFPSAAPRTVRNFIEKATNGYYDGLIFHRVEDWVIQGGDPRGNGTGGGQMPTELNDRPFVVGAVGVARGRDIAVSNDSQFFICIKPAEWLNREYTNFGQVVAGMETARAVKRGDKIKRIVISE